MGAVMAKANEQEATQVVQVRAKALTTTIGMVRKR